MKAILLAAGKGKRLKEVTKSIPKPMIQINRKPILEHNINWLKRYGINDIYINLHHLPDVIRDYFEDGSMLGVKITYSYEYELFGTAGAVKKIAQECWQSQAFPFFVVYGDNLFEYDLKQIFDFHQRKKGIATIAVYEKDDVGQSGIVLLSEENRVLNFIEKPGPEEIVSNLVNTGIYVLETDVLDYIPSKKEFDFGKDLFPEMIQKGEEIFGITVKGSLMAVDTPELLNRAVNPVRKPQPRYGIFLPHLKGDDS